MSTFLQFMHMGGYGFYVWSAYGSIFVLLTLQWLLPWRRWQRYRASNKV